MRLSRALVFSALAVLGACNGAPAHRRKCFTLAIGMPASQLLDVMGQPQEKLGGETVSYIYGRRSPDETSIDTIGVSEETGKIVSVVCGDKPVRQFFTAQDAEDDREQADGEKAEGRKLQSQNDAALHALKLAQQKWQWKNGGFSHHPPALADLSALLPGGILPELELPKHGVSRWAETYPAEACAMQGDIPRVDYTKLRDTGQWGYIADGPCAGHAFIDCAHFAGRGRRWCQMF